MPWLLASHAVAAHVASYYSGTIGTLYHTLSKVAASHMRTFGCDKQPTATHQWPRYQRSSDIVRQAFPTTATYSSIHRQNHTTNYNIGTLAPVYNCMLHTLIGRDPTVFLQATACITTYAASPDPSLLSSAPYLQAYVWVQPGPPTGIAPGSPAGELHQNSSWSTTTISLGPYPHTPCSINSQGQPCHSEPQQE